MALCWGRMHALIHLNVYTKHSLSSMYTVDEISASAVFRTSRLWPPNTRNVVTSCVHNLDVGTGLHILQQVCNSRNHAPSSITVLSIESDSLSYIIYQPVALVSWSIFNPIAPLNIETLNMSEESLELPRATIEEIPWTWNRMSFLVAHCFVGYAHTIIQNAKRVRAVWCQTDLLCQYKRSNT